MFSPPIAKSAQRNAINSGRGGTHLHSRVKCAELSYYPTAGKQQATSAIEPAPWDFAKVPVFPPGPPRPSWSHSRAGELFGILQTKLAVGSVHDAAEAEADAMAARALGDGSVSAIAPHSLPAAIQRKCGCSGSREKCDDCKEEESRPVQRKATCSLPAAAAPLIVHRALSNCGQPLDAATRAYLEPRFGFDFGHVRIHSDAVAAESASAIQALAYTVNHSIVFGAGTYAPGTSPGRRLLAHELAHVIQQRSAPALAQDKVPVGSGKDPVEQDAEQCARAVLSDGAAGVSQPRLSSAAVIRRSPDPPASDTWTTQQDIGDIREAKPPLEFTKDKHSVTVNVTRKYKRCNFIKVDDRRSAVFYNGSLSQLAIDYRSCKGSTVVDAFVKEFQDSQAKGVEAGVAVNVAGDKTQGRVEVGAIGQDATKTNTGGVGGRVEGSLTTHGVDLNVTGKYVRNILNKVAGSDPNEVDVSVGGAIGSTSVSVTGTDLTTGKRQVGVSVQGTWDKPEQTQCFICFSPAPTRVFECTEVLHTLSDPPKPDTPQEQKPVTLTPEYRMYFAWDSVNPSEEDYLNTATDDNMRKMKEDLAKPGYRVTQISGYASPEGLERVINRPLAQKRAKALAKVVRDALSALGRGSDSVPEPAGHSELLGNNPAPPSPHLRDAIAASGKHSAEEVTALLTGSEIVPSQMTAEFLDLFKRTTPDEWMQLFGLGADSSLRSEVEGAVNAFIGSNGKGKRPWERVFRPLRYASVYLKGTEMPVAPKREEPASSKPDVPASPDGKAVPVTEDGQCQMYGEKAEREGRFGPAIDASILEPQSFITKSKDDCATASNVGTGRTAGCNYTIPKKSDQTASPPPPAPSFAPKRL